ncbi:Fibronectin type III domain-containing protein [Geodermatophilus africanus]|uniref:Fibronectin type III domain-containing protein n=1 Tax=Geodermatophilus africanus TaxID=1137993 RepID=A0A1H3GEY2_9ACTN|nr:Fibronectin type III domain-containing protein [Geodermatophilus africanus]
MTRTRPTQHGGRGGGHGAVGAPASRTSRSPKRLIAGGLAAVTATGALVTFGSMAQAGTPPTGPGNIEIFNKRSMVALEGYAAQAGQEATVEVLRGDRTIGIGVGTLDATGFLEFNHPGGECWIGVTPTIKPGDEVRVSFSGEAFTDSAITASPTVTEVVGSGFVPDGAVQPEGSLRVSGTGTVTIKGTYDPADPWFDPARFVIETVNPDNRDDKTPPGQDPGLVDARAMGITLVPDAEHPNGEPGLWDAEATIDPATGTWSGTYTLYTQADYDRTLDGDHVAAAWMAGEEPALGLTQNEFEEIPGPGMGGCPPSPDGQVPTAPSTAQLSSATGSTSVEVAWETPAQPADASEVTGYRVAAIGGAHAEQETAERTGGTSVSLDGLEAGATYEIMIEAYNGRWSAAQSLGTVVVGSGTGGTTPPGDGTDPGTDPTALPAAPAGLTATSASLDSADVSWAATAGATSYTVTASSEDPAALVPAPVTVTAPAATLTGLTSGAAYTVSVTAANANGEGPASTATVSTLTAVAPAAFDLTRVIPGHESITAEWTAAAAGNAASPVSGYELVATPADGQAAVTFAATGTAGTVSGLRNGVEYALTVVAKSGSATTTARVPATVDNTVTPTDVVTVTRAQYRADKREYRIQGTAQDTTANRVHLRLGDVAGSGTTIQLNVPVQADGTWAVDLRNGPALPTNNRFNVTSDSGASTVAVMTRSR